MEARISRNLLIVFVVAVVTGTALLAAYANTESVWSGACPQIRACQAGCGNSCCQVKACLSPGCGGGCSGSSDAAGAADNAGSCGPKGCTTERTNNCGDKETCTMGK